MAATTTASAPSPRRPFFQHKCKSSSQSKAKTQKVQINLELKVEKAKGFAAFFSIPVPAGRSVPRAPPSSPVLCASTVVPQHGHQGMAMGDKMGNIQQVEYSVDNDGVEPMVLC